MRRVPGVHAPYGRRDGVLQGRTDQALAGNVHHVPAGVRPGGGRMPLRGRHRGKRRGSRGPRVRRDPVYLVWGAHRRVQGIRRGDTMKGETEYDQDLRDAHMPLLRLYP